MAPHPRSYAHMGEHGTPRTVGTAPLTPAQSWSDQYSVDTRDGHSAVGWRQQGWVGMAELEQLLRKMCW